MSSTGASSSSRGKRKASNSISRAEKVGLQFPVARVNRYLKEGKYASRIYVAASVYLTAVLEYLAAEVLKLAGDKAKENNKTRILPSHLKSAIQNDEELMKILGGDITIPDSGVLHKIHQALLPKIIAEREKEAIKKATK